MEEDLDKKAGKVPEEVIKPDLPWDIWLEKTKERLSRTRQNLDAKSILIHDIHSDGQEWAKVAALNTEFRKNILAPNNSVFYRPGIGWGGALVEMLEKAGCFTTMIVTDPVYRQKDMASWSEGILPIEYYYKTLQLLEADKIEVEIISSRGASRKALETEIASIELQEGDEAKYHYSLNGVKHTLVVANFDMTKKAPQHYDILGLGRPTPYNDETTHDPRDSQEFLKLAIQNLRLNGLIHYSEQNFRFLPPLLPESVYGFQTTFRIGDEVVIQKTDDKENELEAVLTAEKATLEAAYALSGSLQYPEAPFAWLVHISELSKIMKKEEPFTYDDVLNNFSSNLKILSDFDLSLNEEGKRELQDRLKFLLLSPIATDGVVDIEKVKKLKSIPSNPDKPQTDASYSRPYFGDVTPIIRDHNSGKVDILDYYQKIIDIFYQYFPRPKTNTA